MHNRQRITQNDSRPLPYPVDDAGPYGMGDAMAIDGQMLTAEQQMQLMQQQQAAMEAAAMEAAAAAAAVAAAGHC